MFFSVANPQDQNRFCRDIYERDPVAKSCVSRELTFHNPLLSDSHLFAVQLLSLQTGHKTSHKNLRFLKGVWVVTSNDSSTGFALEDRDLD